MSRQLSKKTLQKVCWRNMFPFQWSWNYETMQGSGYGWVVWPAMKELYGDDPEKMKEMLRAESGYFNTTPAMSHLIVGADLALQEELGTESKDMVMAMKSGLMGPFAGVGDKIFLAIYRAVFFSIASYFALEDVYKRQRRMSPNQSLEQQASLRALSRACPSPQLLSIMRRQSCLQTSSPTTQISWSSAIRIPLCLRQKRRQRIPTLPLTQRRSRAAQEKRRQRPYPSALTWALA